MYSNIPGVQILISLLKQYNIKHIVASPGSRNAALVHSLENDSFFKLYSMVDERSAGYFALGLAEKLDEPVCVSCTSATATCNYLPAIKEAFEREIPLISLTADRNPQKKFHMDDQNINQLNMFDGFVKYAVNVPTIKNSEDRWFFNRCVNEALLHLDYQGKGPIQINFEMDYGLEPLSSFPTKTLPKSRKIEKYNSNIDWNSLASELKEKKVMILGASNYYDDNSVKEQILEFANKTNAVIIADYYSNIIGEKIINASVLGNFYGDKDVQNLKPDIIIFFGNVVYMPLKYRLDIFKSAKTWQISKNIRLNDGFRNVTKIFEMTELDFFENINKSLEKCNNIDYYRAWKNIMDIIKYPELDFTHMYIIKSLIEKMPSDVLIHTSVLDAIRITNYYELPKDVRVFGNIGADGIDGALSTFLGQASQSDKLAFLIVGDLSFIYDMNSLYMQLPKNIRILVINNYAGSEFYRNFGTKRIPTLRDYIAAGHDSSMKDVSSISNLKYLNAINKDELNKRLNEFISESDKPIILEAITNADLDSKQLIKFWEMNKPLFQTGKAKMKEKIKKVIGQDMKNKIKSILKK